MAERMGASILYFLQITVVLLLSKQVTPYVSAYKVLIPFNSLHDHGHRNCIVYSTKLQSVNRGDMYDPITNDPVLHEKYRREMELISNMPTLHIKKDLLANDSGIFRHNKLVERQELIQTLARMRVKEKLKQQQDNEQSKVNKDKRAQLLFDEIVTIKRLFVADRDIINELRRRKIDFDPFLDIKDLIVILAVARLNAQQNVPSVSPTSSIAVERNVMDNISSLIGFVDDKLKEKSYVYSVGNVTDAIGAAVQDVTSTLMLTDSEKIASEMVKKKYTKQTSVVTKSDSDSATEMDKVDVNKVSINKMSPEEVQEINRQLEILCSNKSTFDDIVKCVEKRPRSHLIQLLDYRGEKVPKYAPQSVLAMIIADSVLGGYVKKEMQQQLLDGFEQVKEEEVDTGRKRVKRKYDVSAYDSFALEKDVVSETFWGLKRTIMKVSKVLRKLPDSPKVVGILKKGTSKILTSSFTNSLITSVKIGCNLSLDTLVQVGRWAAGEQYLKPIQTVVLVSAYTMLRRKGLLTFLSSFLVIRLFRVIFVSFNDSNTATTKAEGSSVKQAIQ